jgi:hypothetical protein
MRRKLKFQPGNDPRRKKRVTNLKRFNHGKAKNGRR